MSLQNSGAEKVLDFIRSRLGLNSTQSKTAAVIGLLSLAYTLQKVVTSKPSRQAKIPAHKERVVILGATSGIGREIALQYASRGARVCIVGRRRELVDQVEAECSALRNSALGIRGSMYETGRVVFGVVGDFANAADMVRLREVLEKEWNGLDTLIVSAGVSALRPLMEVAGVESAGERASLEGIQNAVRVSDAAVKGNFTGPLVAAVTFIPLLTQTSASPGILLVSSLAALIPAPTRTLYAATKSASLLLYQALSIEHPNVTITNVVPSTVEGDFRASAVDGGKVREADPSKTGLKRVAVAKRCIDAVDRREKTVWMPGTMRWAHLLYWFFPTFIEGKARKKYNFTS
ncbi:hypothetical protein CVT24_004505 [Panaeolus cyanescens]|uniref:NAD(P)-binding protein n=1 Tax=Panaeolus cyanescens TaxID=181874 RepID=A0A409YBQ9_9AGAR|nr:hypothetical protein CVT24_004505 [Panaeolus cyanescens]